MTTQELVARWLYSQDSKEFVRVGWDFDSDGLKGDYMDRAYSFMTDTGILAIVNSAYAMARGVARQAEELFGPTAPGAAAMFDPDYIMMGVEDPAAWSRFNSFTTTELEMMDECLAGEENAGILREEIERVLKER